jgi:hypothetical protein
MDAERFDTLTRSLSAPSSRRTVAALGGVLGLALGASSPPDAGAKKKPCPPCKKRKQGKCKKNKPDGTACSGGTCLDGRCRCVPTTCAAQGMSCGSIPDGCGSTLQCGTCTDPRVCGAGTCCLPQGEQCAGASDDASCCGALLCNDGPATDVCTTCLTVGARGCTGTVGQTNPGTRPCCEGLLCDSAVTGGGTECFLI